MKKFFSATAAALSAIIMATAMVGCGDGGGNSSDGKNMVGAGIEGGSGDVDEADFPYGSTIVELSNAEDEKIKIRIAFDKRFFVGDEENPDYSEIYKIHDYVRSINDKDGEMLKSLYYPGYLAEVTKNKGYDGEDDYVDYFFSGIEEALGEGFEIDYIDISDCILGSNEEASNYFNTCDSALAKVSGADILDKVTSRKVVEIGGYSTYKQDGNSYQLTDHVNIPYLCLYTIDGQVYII